jgi:ParB family chromosome partitioning protein
MATATAEVLNGQFVDRMIPLHLIDEPDNPERETMDEAMLADLALSISEVGLLKPLIVTQNGDRVKVTAGHRRLLACRIVDYSPVPCRIFTSGDVDELAIMIAENEAVESVNPVEQARFYRRVLEERCGNDVDALCLVVRRKRGHVEDRLLLLMGWPRVVAALEARQITIAVARELNKVKDENRMLILLDQSVMMGATARQVAEWRKDAATMPPIVLPEDSSDPNAAPAANTTANYQPRCLFCGSSEDPSMMDFVHIHRYCGRALDNMLSGPAAGQQQ